MQSAKVLLSSTAIVTLSSALAGASAGHPVTMREAYTLTASAAKKWHADAGLYEINSADLAGVTNSQEGLDGRRRVWYVDYYSKSAQKHFVLRVEDGRVIPKSIGVNPFLHDFIQPADIPDTTKLARLALSKGLKPSNSVAFGLHFDIGEELVDSANQPVRIQVYGRPGGVSTASVNGGGSLTRLVFDTSSNLVEGGR